MYKFSVLPITLRSLTLRSIILPAIIGLTISGCASRPNAIAPTNVSALEYQNSSCEETKAMLDQRRATLATLIKKQNMAATGDAVGVLFVLIPVSTIFGADNEGALAQTKGEVLALERAIPMNCAVES